VVMLFPALFTLFEPLTSFPLLLLAFFFLLFPPLPLLLSFLAFLLLVIIIIVRLLTILVMIGVSMMSKDGLAYFRRSKWQKYSHFFSS
jgi:hypothetical protein